MEFKERIKSLREQAGLTQEQLVKKSNITVRMIQQYEYGLSKPRYDTVKKLANALGVSVDTILSDDDLFVLKARENYGSRGEKQASQLLEEVTGLFSGGKMAEEDMDAWMKAIQDAYWIAKENNKKYGRKK